MMSRHLNKRLDSLEGPGGLARPHCWVIANDDEDAVSAVARHKAEEGCIEGSGGHIVWVTI
jgi:hypothetical protein